MAILDTFTPADDLGKRIRAALGIKRDVALERVVVDINYARGGLPTVYVKAIAPKAVGEAIAERLESGPAEVVPVVDVVVDERGNVTATPIYPASCAPASPPKRFRLGPPGDGEAVYVKPGDTVIATRKRHKGSVFETVEEVPCTVTDGGLAQVLGTVGVYVTLEHCRLPDGI